MSNLDYKEFYHKNLPHFQLEGGVIAISFRLAFSLPNHIIEKLTQEKKWFDETVRKVLKKTNLSLERV